MNGSFTYKAKYQATLTARIFWIRLDDFTIQKRRFQFGDGQSIRKTLVIRMQRYLIRLAIYLSANETMLEWHETIIQQEWKHGAVGLTGFIVARVHWDDCVNMGAG